MTQRPTPATDFARFIAKVCPKPNSGCWLWTGAIKGGGYGNFGGARGTISAYRFSYQHFVGPIPEGLHLDHLCRVRSCVNPDHLEAVTQRENTLRGENPPARNVLKTECMRGHSFTAENTYVDRKGGRSCLICRRAAWKAFAPTRGQNSRPERGRKKNTHCKWGHEFTPENTIQARYGRSCRTCQAAAVDRYRARKRAAR